ncbi:MULTISPECIES: enoyl-CoA hydratase/isomerase family protein [Shewanella]|uniref:Enoyl-CoA hydratase/isomerase family protein n=1 Tax=Shewanella fidelis TaxID=173509 RepID=A0AAW8NIY3_9GAMM|nr:MULTISPECIES: enoyl-CoA hydratase/isomerase family protein [Shewanella]MDR8523277.1 enoyl-CoA hydratase/isomerase family protein [Shewanella fidelis]MDW4811397.1 enoyl-CoA hydratase/isomerase family protein [Shewanella fidelis]MDW4815518.1 enoyl-CoA hydratase/isomerase family protein [Shewanella fidelis]MDW4819608.1 enoyl-CoA hydratase/isomerase family protein [Shewanella fidelis]MDW4824418.1 enoyl-CoA hydratase/isomerase family protein [Shewanella fidelis]
MNKLSITTENYITTVSINNPPVNVLTIDLINEINAFVLSLKDNRDTKIVVFKSLHEQFFLAHLDLNVINGTQGGQAASIEFNHMIANIKAMKQLSVAVVDGVARGGGNEFVMACDLAYGTENAAFAQPEVHVNIPTGGQGAVQFARRLGKGKALQALLLGNDFSAQQAEALNIITQYVAKAELDGFLTQTLTVIAGLEIRDIVMYKEIIQSAIIDENAGAELELRYFLERAKEQKTQAIISAFLKHGGQTEREAKDIQGIFVDTAAALSNAEVQ